MPIVALVVYSFNDSPVANVWRGFTLEWYAALADDRELLAGLALSLKVAFATACASVVLGTLAAFALVRYRRFFGRTLFSGMVAAPLVMPEVIIGLSLLLMLVSLQRATEAAFGVGFPERGMLTIWLGHLLLGMAYATVVVRARLQTLNPQLEEAAMDLGARPWQVFWLVTLPMIGQALLSAFLLTFTLSLDDVVLSAFLSGPGRDDDAAGHLLARPARPQPERQRGGDDHHRRRRDRRRRRQLRASPATSAAARSTPPTAQRPTARHEPRRRRASGVAYLCLAAAMAIVGAYVGFSKALVIVFPVFLLAWLRFAIAAVAMAPWLRRPAGEAPLDRRSAPPALPRVVLRQLPVLDLHAVRHPPEHGARRRRDHGGAARPSSPCSRWWLLRRARRRCASPPASPARSPASPWSRSRATPTASSRAARWSASLLLSAR